MRCQLNLIPKLGFAEKCSLVNYLYSYGVWTQPASWPETQSCYRCVWVCRFRWVAGQVWRLGGRPAKRTLRQRCRKFAQFSDFTKETGKGFFFLPIHLLHFFRFNMFNENVCVFGSFRLRLRSIVHNASDYWADWGFEQRRGSGSSKLI